MLLFATGLSKCTQIQLKFPNCDQILKQLLLQIEYLRVNDGAAPSIMVYIGVLCLVYPILSSFKLHKQWYQFQTLKLLHCRPPTYFPFCAREKHHTLNWTSWLCQAMIQSMDLYLLGYITVHESTKIKLNSCNDRRPHCLQKRGKALSSSSIWFKR